MLKTLMWAIISVIALVATAENLMGADGTKADTWAKQVAEKDPRNAKWRALKARKVSVGLIEQQCRKYINGPRKAEALDEVASQLYHWRETAYDIADAMNYDHIPTARTLCMDLKTLNIIR